MRWLARPTSFSNVGRTFSFFFSPFYLFCSFAPFVFLWCYLRLGGKKQLGRSFLMFWVCDVSSGKRRHKEIFGRGCTDSWPTRLKGQFSTLTHPGFRGLSNLPTLPTLEASSAHGEAGVGPDLHLKSVFLFMAGRFPPAQHHLDAQFKGSPGSLNPFLYDTTYPLLFPARLKSCGLNWLELTDLLRATVPYAGFSVLPPHLSYR